MREERVGWANGVVFDLGKTRFLFDPASGRPLGRDYDIFITHAHSDHTYGFTRTSKKHCTKETLQIYEALRERPVKNCQTLSIGEKIDIDNCEITALNAGHMLGSCQFEIVTPKFTAIYTGDINCVDTLTTKAAEHRGCDYLIIEATYGHPSYLFPRRSTTYADIIKWALTEIKNGKTPTFQVYSSGKPQEIVRLFNVYTKIPVVCALSIAHANAAHTQSGLRLDYLDASMPEGKQALRAGGCVYITPSRSDHVPRNASRAVTTGWALKQAFRRCTSFPLSSHADYHQLMRFVAAVNPKRVYVFTGYADVLSRQIERDMDIGADPLPVLSQTKLLDFDEVTV